MRKAVCIRGLAAASFEAGIQESADTVKTSPRMSVH